MEYEKTIIQMDNKELRKKIWELWGEIEKKDAKIAELKEAIKANKPDLHFDLLKRRYKDLLIRYNKLLNIDVTKFDYEIDEDANNIISMIGEFYRVDPKNRNRGRTVVKSRHVCFYVLYKRGYALEQIGKIFTSHEIAYDHSTVLYGKNKITHAIMNYPQSEQDFINKMIQ